MTLLVVGLVLLLGMHTFTTFRDARARAIAGLGSNRYRGLHALVAIIGFVLIVLGFPDYRVHGLIPVWSPPVWTHHITILLMWFAWVSLTLAYSGPSRIKGWIKHPMLLAIKIWALAHLIANGDLGGIVLFGSFLLWAGYDRYMLKRRGDSGAPKLDHFARGDAIGLVVGTILYLAMIALHPYLIGVSVM